jgi:putative DNA primase/helicase
MEATVDPQPRGPDWMPITPKTGPLFHADSQQVSAADNRTTTMAVLDAPDFYSLNDRITALGEFRKYDGRKNDWRRVDPPALVAHTLLARKKWSFPPIAGIITTPLLRPDGSILASSGYDSETRLYLAFDRSLQLPSISTRPSREDAQAALKLLTDLLSEFPFVDEMDCSVALSMLVTALVRPSMTVAPFHLIRAHAAGTGKSYLVDIAAAIATGRWAPAIDMNRGGEEIGKRLEAMLVAGGPIISLDNLEGEIGGPALCLVTERPVVSFRLLGRSELVEIESRAAILGTGNNVSPTSDIVRRTLVADLDALEEQPELRHSRSNQLTA